MVPPLYWPQSSSPAVPEGIDSPGYRQTTGPESYDAYRLEFDAALIENPDFQKSTRHLT